MGTGDGTNGVSALAARYSEAFTAYLADRGEKALGAAYDLGREAVAAQLSVLDLAEAHHAALRDGRRPRRASTLHAAADFLRESLSMFETVHRGYLEVQEVARLEHEYVEQLRALADASVAINLSLTVEAILQLTADAARADPALRPRDGRGARPRPAPAPADRHLAPAPRRRRPAARAAEAQLTGRGKELGVVEVIDDHDREFTTRDEAILTQLAQLASSRSPTPSSTSASARSRAPSSARCARAGCRRCPG